MIKKHLIIVIGFLLESPSKLLLIKVIHQGTACPFCRHCSQDQRRTGCLTQHVVLSKHGMTDGWEFLPQP